VTEAPATKAPAMLALPDGTKVATLNGVTDAAADLHVLHAFEVIDGRRSSRTTPTRERG
jgi:hypothetical protein